MLVIYERNDTRWEPYLVIDYENREMWGYDPMWSNNPHWVDMDPDEMKERFEGSFNWAIQEEDVDPFRDIPMSADVLRNYPPGSEDIPETDWFEPDTAEKVAERAIERFEDGGGGDTPGNRKTAADPSTAALDSDEYDECDDALRDMHKRLVEWNGDDLAKAPPAWAEDRDIPDFVKAFILEAFDRDVMWDKFEGYSRQAANAIENSIRDNLTQPQGWSINSLVNDLRSIYPGMSEDKAVNIARTETSAILNTAREEAYESRGDEIEEYSYYWQGPDDHRTTKVCEEIKADVERRGGSVPLDDLNIILMEKAKKYEDTREGGTPERVDEWTPHFQCRHTFVRDVKADLE